MKKNTGFDLKRELAEQQPEDWIFGADSELCIALIPEPERHVYLPAGELQKGLEDFQDCASRAPLNILETKFLFLIRNNKISDQNLQWLYDNGYITFD